MLAKSCGRARYEVCREESSGGGGFVLQDRKEKKSFFNWFYFAINFGSLLAVTVVVYIQDSISWAIGFAIPAVAMLFAILTFVGGSSKYKHVEPTER